MEKTINFRISEQYKDELQIIASEKQIRISVLIREIIKEYLEAYHSRENLKLLENSSIIELVVSHREIVLPARQNNSF